MRFVVFFVLFVGVNSQLRSPCPRVLSYEPKGTETDQWYGVISVSSPIRLRSVFLSIILDRPAEVLGNWFGEVTSTDKKEYLIFNQTYTLEPNRPLTVRFFVKYNTANTAPSVQEILFNGRSVCPQNNQADPLIFDTSSERSTTRSTRRTTTRPNNFDERPTTRRPTNRPNNDNFEPSRQTTRPSNFNDDFNRPTTRRPTYSSTTRRPVQRPDYDNFGQSSTGLSAESEEVFGGDFAVVVDRPEPTVHQQFSNNDHSCGEAVIQANALISYGQSTKPGQWPWHVAIYHSNGIKMAYICGGTLVSQKHVITAAHCVTRPHSNKAIKPSEIVLYLGKYNLKKFGPESQVKEVEKISVQPQYNYSVYFNDIAVLTMSEPVQFTNYVRPCCLWEGDEDLDSIIDRLGTVIGWGFDQDRRLSFELMQAQMPVVSTVTCIYSNREFFSQFTSEKTFCAGFRNGTTVCNGDSGGGMVFPRRGGSAWQLRGVVSVGVALQGKGVCDPSQYIVFTDVAKHADWIRRVMND